MSEATKHAKAMLIEAVNLTYRHPGYANSVAEGIEADRPGHVSRDVALKALELSYETMQESKR